MSSITVASSTKDKRIPMPLGTSSVFGVGRFGKTREKLADIGFRFLICACLQNFINTKLSLFVLNTSAPLFPSFIP